MKATLGPLIPRGAAAVQALRDLPGVYARALASQSNPDAAAAEPVVLCCESASATATEIEISGWAVARSGTRAVEIFIDGEPVEPVQLGIRRIDVGARYPELRGSNHAGFTVKVPISRLAGTPARRLHIVAHSEAGASAEHTRDLSAGDLSPKADANQTGGADLERIPDDYRLVFPSAQNALDIFQGKWVCRLPGEASSLRAGEMGLFDDERVSWGLEALGGAREKTVVELGPLEGGHTYMLEHAGAERIVAIEANSHAYLKCLVVKEVLELRRAQFLCGDFVEYLRTCATRFDLCLAIGILYHMPNPVELLSLIARVTDSILLWTHYYDPAIINARPALAGTFSAMRASEHAGLTHTLYQVEQGGVREAPTLLGGNAMYSCWLERADILRALQHFGFVHHKVGFDTPDHPQGPCFAVAASKHPLPSASTQS